MSNKPEVTQGQKKIVQLFNDIKRNQTFLDVYDKVKDTFEEHLWSRMDLLAEGDDDRAPDYNLCFGVVCSLRQLSHESKRFGKNIKYLLKKYSVNLSMLSYLVSEYLLECDPELSKTYTIESESPDMCRLSRRHRIRISQGLDDEDQEENDYGAFPISIDIHAFATKRDVLDFVNKRWGDVQFMTSLDRKKPIRIRKRSIPIEVTDYIWENQKLPRKELNKLVKKKFPDFNFGYDGIAKIISLEKKRRTGKLP